MATFLSVAFVVFLLGGGLAFATWYTKSSMEQEPQCAGAEPRAEMVDLEQYVTGLPSCEKAAAGVKCSMVGEKLIFTSARSIELGRIPNGSINDIFVDDKTTVHKRITATRLLALGVFALAVPKTTTESEYCLVIDWNDQGGARQNALFLFSGPGSMGRAHYAANFLRRQCSAGGAESALCQQAV